MEISQSSTVHRRSGERGFSLLEVLIAITILAVGMLALGGFISKMDVNTGRSRYMSLQAVLASEKLEQLSRYPLKDMNIAVTTGTTAGSLTADTTAGTVDYFDQVQIASGDGAIAETTTGKDASGNTTYNTISQSPNGEITKQLPPNSAPVTFKRRWLIEKDTPVFGVSRITVVVSLQNSGANLARDFQMSMVRRYEE